MLKKYLWGGVVIFIAGTVFALGGIGGKKGDLLSKAKAGDADAQYMLAEQLEMTTDPVNLKKSEFYYWLKKAAKNGNGQAQDLLHDIDAEYDRKALEDELAPNGSQKLMDEVAKLERQKRKNYPLIKEKLFKAGTLGNFSALVKTAWLFGNQDAAREYGVPFYPLKACILSVYTNNRYGDLNKDAMDVLCSGIYYEHNAKKIDGYVKRIEDKPAKIWSILENVK
ncbi:hypothetical protein [Neisseria sicca]|jgi:hypothetical protein|uniref:Sel1 repeat protein n=1 Tax=Neisseria sicca VK64 TaxID=1095748 RepID=I2NC17_NEISI|nr:hypothetical protein [Neisseria sicca]EIG23378.1 hypothetical protein HMPREF1051_2345 [Neisseria sicca VK64]